MSFDSAELRFLADCAERAARAAGDLVKSVRPDDIKFKRGHSAASQIVTDVDRQAETLILKILAPAIERVGGGVLSEESFDDGSRHRSEYFWCIDPLDGTLPYTEGEPGYAISIALVSRDGVPEIGVIVDPARDVVFSAIHKLGIVRNGESWAPSLQPSQETLSVFVDRSMQSRPDYPRVIASLDALATSMGLVSARVHVGYGAVVNACQALGSAPACYFKFPKASTGGGSLWDFAATACLFTEAKAAVSDMHGETLDLNRADSTFMNHRGVVFATDIELARRVRSLFTH